MGDAGLSINSTEFSNILHRLQRMEDIHAINQLMGRRAFLHSAGRHDREIDEMWCQTDDVVFEAEDVGAWVGIRSIRKAYVENDPFPRGTTGLLIEHTVTTPVIEVADDGQTAKGVWISPGHETFPVPNGTPKAHWSWGRYAVDFKKENGQWKIWHLHVLTTFRTPFDQDWVDVALNRPKWLPEEGNQEDTVGVADRGVSFNAPYHPDRASVYQPVPPEPYKAWKDTFSATDFYQHPRESE